MDDCLIFSRDDSTIDKNLLNTLLLEDKADDQDILRIRNQDYQGQADANNNYDTNSSYWVHHSEQKHHQWTLS